METIITQTGGLDFIKNLSKAKIITLVVVIFIVGAFFGVILNKYSGGKISKHVNLIPASGECVDTLADIDENLIEIKKQQMYSFSEEKDTFIGTFNKIEGKNIVITRFSRDPFTNYKNVSTIPLDPDLIFYRLTKKDVNMFKIEIDNFVKQLELQNTNKIKLEQITSVALKPYLKTQVDYLQLQPGDVVVVKSKMYDFK